MKQNLKKIQIFEVIYNTVLLKKWMHYKYWLNKYTNLAMRIKPSIILKKCLNMYMYTCECVDEKNISEDW